MDKVADTLTGRNKNREVDALAPEPTQMRLGR
jgi:hypothetical protein